MQLALAVLGLMAGVPETGTSTSAVPKIELITIGPGQYLYSWWGHSALRVIDPRDQTDASYNFGGVEIDEDFFMKMMRGYVQAYVFRTSYPELLTQYSGEDRTITRRPLTLSDDAARALADSLAELT